MIRNYFKTALRNLWKNKLYTFVNIFGLGIGIASCLLIVIYIFHEYSYDKFHKHASNIYMMYGELRMGENNILLPEVSYPTGDIVQKNFPDVISFVRVKQIEKPVALGVSNSATNFFESNIIFADPAFFNIFSFPLLSGNPATILNAPFKIVISKRAARKYFGNETPVGKTLQYDKHITFEITGVADTPPSNSSIDFDFVGSLSSLRQLEQYQSAFGQQGIGLGGFKTYFYINPDKVAKTEKNINQLVFQTDHENPAKFHLMRFADGHLYLNFGDISNIKYLKIFSLISAVILLLAIINYISLAITAYTSRTKEIGIRKVIGAGRSGIAWQYYTESALNVSFACMIGFTVFVLILPHFYRLLDLKISASFFLEPIVLGGLLLIPLITILLSGSYPALVLSSLLPVDALYKRSNKVHNGRMIRKTFVTLQFVISAVLIIFCIVMNKQLHYMKNADTGINMNNLVMVPFGKEINQHYTSVKEQLSGINGVQAVSAAGYQMYGGYDMSFAKMGQNDAFVSIPTLQIDSSFISLLQLKWKFRPSGSFHNNTIVINEAVIAKLKLADNPVGSRIIINDQDFFVGGVLKNFHFASMQSPIDGLFFNIRNDSSMMWSPYTDGCFYIRLHNGIDAGQVIRQINSIYNAYETNIPFQYQYLSTVFKDLYKSEDRLISIITFFTVLAIVVASLGLLALVIFTTQLRTREVSIRKIMGADANAIIRLLLLNFLQPVLIAICLATPLALLIIRRWLENFAFIITVKWYYFMEAYAIILVIALLTIGYTSVKAALVNPLKNLN
ncbi:ABC transporter permease [Chitinophaga qingshengii]|uniref:ABC transporter permease n=1 Tax=Chitinophaga qingshengii TaxID=1569794 RepID=A0ABR7TQQ9_9BACT|nr:ABC transporter permease [Chitinophaga qingshengii]MBC9931933.1 ABC transporter permease [Chitinophaga qingshengii]